MIKALSRFEEKIKSKIPQRTLLLLPGEFFFTQMAELPDGIEDKDIEQFAEFSLESVSPFPLEHLYWGFQHHEDSPHILIYAAYRERLRKNGYENLEKHDHVFPDFVAGLPETRDQPEISFLNHEASLSALYFKPGCRVPVNARSMPLPEAEMEDEELLQQREELLASIDPAGFQASGEVRSIAITEGKAGRNPELFSRTINGTDTDTSAPWRHDDSFPALSEKGCWEADVRDKNFVQRERKALAASKKVWFAAMGAGIAAGLLLLLQLGVMAGNMWVNNRENIIVRQAPEAANVEERLSLLEKIDQYVQQELRPFEMLSLLNAGRPKIIHFTEAASNAYNQMEVEGVGNNVEAVNGYTQTLRNSARISSVETRVRSSGGKAPFTLVITFLDEPQSEEDETDPSQVVAEVESSK